MLGLYGAAKLPGAQGPSPLGAAVAQETAIDVIADLLHWLRVHGLDADEALDRAQMRFESEAEQAGGEE
jgi:hypothetical protein